MTRSKFDPLIFDCTRYEIGYSVGHQSNLIHLNRQNTGSVWHWIIKLDVFLFMGYLFILRLVYIPVFSGIKLLKLNRIMLFIIFDSKRSHLLPTSDAGFTDEVDIRLAKPPLNFNGRLAKFVSDIGEIYVRLTHITTNFGRFVIFISCRHIYLWKSAPQYESYLEVIDCARPRPPGFIYWGVAGPESHEGCYHTFLSEEIIMMLWCLTWSYEGYHRLVC